jgi:hypothetical protein
MADADGPLNFVTIGGSQLLLVHRTQRTVHLARETRNGGVPAIEPCGVGEATVDLPLFVDLLELDQLEADRWHTRTLCGRRWTAMAWKEPIADGLVALAPSCRTCLRIIDHHLTHAQPHPRLPDIVDVVTEMLLAYGWACVCAVPGDQVETLRAQIRRAARALDLRVITEVDFDTVIVDSEDAWRALPSEVREQLDGMLVEQLRQLLVDGYAPTMNQPWVVEWPS